MKAIIQAHNKKTLNKKRQTEAENFGCNCQVSKKDDCPLEGQCQRFNVIYEATTEDKKKYIGSTENFKARWSTHKYSFKTNSEECSTALSKHIANEGLGQYPDIKWKILASAPAYRVGGRLCSLCLTEKLLILKHSRDPNHQNGTCAGMPAQGEMAPGPDNITQAQRGGGRGGTF